MADDKLSYKLTDREAGLVYLAARVSHQTVSAYVRQAIQEQLARSRNPRIIRLNMPDELPPPRREIPETVWVQLEQLPHDIVSNRMDLWITPEDDVPRIKEVAGWTHGGEVSPFIRDAILARLEREGWSL